MFDVHARPSLASARTVLQDGLMVAGSLRFQARRVGYEKAEVEVVHTVGWFQRALEILDAALFAEDVT